MIRLRHAAVLLLCLQFAIGCTSQKAASGLSRENSHLRWLIRLYIQAGQQGRQPKSEKELKQFIAGMPADFRERVLSSAGVSSVDDLFVSERDRLPYVVFYDRAPAGVTSGVIAFEQQGVDDRRYVGYSIGIVEEADEERFNSIVPPAARTPK
jgi:hypothetical protein